MYTYILLISLKRWALHKQVLTRIAKKSRNVYLTSGGNNWKLLKTENWKLLSVLRSVFISCVFYFPYKLLYYVMVHLWFKSDEIRFTFGSFTVKTFVVFLTSSMKRQLFHSIWMPRIMCSWLCDADRAKENRPKAICDNTQIMYTGERLISAFLKNSIRISREFVGKST